jgi:DNA-binding CsgD family transcriptional regulator
MSLPDATVIELYSQGKSCAEIARSERCSETSIYNRLKFLGIKMRSRSRANKIFPDFVFIILYNMGLSASQVGKLLGIDSSTVTKRLHTLGFPLRSRYVASKIRYTDKEFNRYFMIPSILNELVALVDNCDR